MYWQVLVVRSYSQFQSLIKEEIVSVVDLHAVDALVDLAQPKTAIAAEVVAVLAMAIGAGWCGMVGLAAPQRFPVQYPQHARVHAVIALHRLGFGAHIQKP